MSKKSLLKQSLQILLGLSLGSAYYQPAAVASTYYTKVLTGNQTTDSANGYTVTTAAGGKLVYTFLSGDQINTVLDRNLSPSAPNNDTVLMAVNLAGYGNDFYLNNTNQSMELKAKTIGAKSGGNTQNNSAYASAYGIYNDGSGSGNLTVGDSTTVLLSSTGGSGTNNQANTMNLSAGGYGVSYQGGNSTFGNDLNIFINTIGGNGISTNTTGSASSIVSSTVRGFTTDRQAILGDRLVISLVGQGGTITVHPKRKRPPRVKPSLREEVFT